MRVCGPFNWIKHLSIFQGPFFIVHSSEDLSFVTENVLNVLEKENNISCKISERDFQLGKETVTEIADKIKSCERTIVVLTKNSMESQWVKYEVLLALERSQHEKYIRLIALVFDDIEVSASTFSQKEITRFTNYFFQCISIYLRLMQTLRLFPLINKE